MIVKPQLPRVVLQQNLSDVGGSRSMRISRTATNHFQDVAPEDLPKRKVGLAAVRL